MKVPAENQRIRQLIDHFSNGKEVVFAKEIGVSQPRINRLFSPDKRSDKFPLVSFDILQAIINKFVDVNAEWVVTGNGSMLKSDGNAGGEVTGVYKLQSDKLVGQQQIPLYNIEASAGIVQLFQDSSQANPIDFISIPNLPKCDGAVYVTGDSMYPLLKSGDIVMYKAINNLPEGIFFGEMYLISIDSNGDEFISVKWVHKSEVSAEHIKLVSENRHHFPKDIHLQNVRAMALIKGSIRINSMF